MRRRKIENWLCQAPRFIALSPLTPILLPGLLVIWVILVAWSRVRRGNIWLGALTSNQKTFVPATRRALALIEKYDAKRYAMLQKELWFIDDCPMTSFGMYSRLLRRCEVDFGRFTFDWENSDAPNYAALLDWNIAVYAALIVHEATHGRLISLGFPYTPRTRVRIERICESEARRFAARLPQTGHNFARDLVRPYDPARWNYWWNTPRLQQAKDGFHRLWNAEKQNQPTEEAKTECAAEK